MKAKCIAHRGDHSKCYENTLEAFISASKGDYFGVECDIHLTKDKKWIIHHDPSFYSSKKKIIIKDEKFEDLLKMKIDNEDNYEAYLPSFEDYLKILKGTGKRPIIEIKPVNPSFRSLKKMINIVKKYFDIEDVDFIAFYPWPLFKLKMKYHKKVHVQQLVEHTHPGMIKFARRHKFNIDIEDIMLTKEIVDSFHKKHQTVNVWTIDDKVSLTKFEEMGVDFITTNVFNQKS